MHLGIGFDHRRTMALKTLLKIDKFYEKKIMRRDFVSVADLQNCCADSNDMVNPYRGGTLVVHLGIGFAHRRALAL